jgi:hypothetical protein
LLDLDADVFMEKVSTRRVIFSGDSFIRQVLIAFSCLFEKHKMIARETTPWASCGKKWPCHNAKNCIQCGPHSGFLSFGFSLKGAQRHPQFQYVNEVNKGQDMTSAGALRQGDIVLLEPGIFDSPQRATDKAWTHVAAHLRTRAKVAWIHTWPAHFATMDGEYNVTELELQEQTPWGSGGSNRSSAHTRDVSRCVDKTDLQRKEVEARSVNAKGQHLDGVLWLNGIEKLGAAKVYSI